MDFLYQILGHDLQAAGLVVLNLIVIESLLSVDNAAVLATMVMDLPKEQREKALKYGILGAYVFRGLCLYFAAWLVQIWWLKPLGGLYLLFLTYSYFKGKSTPNDPTDDYVDKKSNWLYRVTVGSLGNFWGQQRNYCRMYRIDVLCFSQTLFRTRLTHPILLKPSLSVCWVTDR